MSSERYRVVRQLECDTYYVGSPVQIEKGNILLDSQTSNLILQLKLCNVSDKTISAVYLTADYYDNTNHLLHSGVELNYLGLNCAPKQNCGSDTPMKLPDNNIYNVKLHIAKVMFIDGSMIDVAPQTIQIPKQQQIAEVFGDEAAGAAKRVLNNSVCYIPQELDSGVWLCGCGQANEKEVCISCGAVKDSVFEVVNSDYLHNEILKYNEREKLEKRNKRKRNKKISIIILILVAIIGSIIAYQIFTDSYRNKIYDILQGTWVSDNNNGNELYFPYEIEESNNKRKEYQELTITKNLQTSFYKYNLYTIKGWGTKDLYGTIESLYSTDDKNELYIRLYNNSLWFDGEYYSKVPTITFRNYNGDILLDIEDIKSAKIEQNNGTKYVLIEWTDTGAQKFQKATKEISEYGDSNNYLYIYWQDIILTKPRVIEEISESSTIISFDDSDEEDIEKMVKLVEEINKWYWQ